jgi:prepilin-type N-terminal cleavage/methylation domain-containing protein
VTRRNGFTLIELLCALTILALVLGVSLRIAAGGSRSTAAVRDYGRALTVAQSHLATLQAGEKFAPLERNGIEDQITWIERVTPADDKAFANEAALKIIAWRVETQATTADGRQVRLSSVNLAHLP